MSEPIPRSPLRLKSALSWSPSPLSTSYNKIKLVFQVSFQYQFQNLSQRVIISLGIKTVQLIYICERKVSSLFAFVNENCLADLRQLEICTWSHSWSQLAPLGNVHWSKSTASISKRKFLNFLKVLSILVNLLFL